MRVLLLNDYGTPMGGAEVQVLRLRELLAERGHEVRLLSSRATTVDVPTSADATAFGTVRERWQTASRTVNLSAARAIHRELDRFQPDVVHVRMFLWQLSPLILPALREVPSLYQVVTYRPICPRGTKLLPDDRICSFPAGVACLRQGCRTPQSWALDMVQLKLWRRWADAFDALVTISDTMRLRLEAAGLSPIRVVRNGVARRPARPPLTGSPLIAFAGRLVHEKGADLLLRAFAMVRSSRSDARLLIAGDGPDRPMLEALIRELGVAESVELAGHLDRATLERRFDEAWVQVVPGRWEEPLGNVTLEAMIRGTATVVTSVGGPPEVVKDGQTGYVVPPEAVAPLAARLKEIVDDLDLAERLGAAGRERALAEHSEAVMVERFEHLYAELANASPSTRRSSP